MGRGQREQDHFEPIFGTRRGAGAEEDEPSLPEETEQELAGHFDEIGAARKEFEDLTHRAEAPILLGQRIAQGIIDQGIPEREFEVPAANGETHHYVIKNVHWTKGHLGRRQHCSGPVIIRNHRGERGKQQPSSLLWDPYDPGRRWDLQDPPEVKYAAYNHQLESNPHLFPDFKLADNKTLGEWGEDAEALLELIKETELRKLATLKRGAASADQTLQKIAD